MTAEQSIIAGMKAFIDNEFAPMIQQLGIIPQSATARPANGIAGVEQRRRYDRLP